MWFQMFSLNIDPGGDFIIRPLSPRDTVYTGLGKPSIHLLTIVQLAFDHNDSRVAQLVEHHAGLQAFLHHNMEVQGQIMSG